MKKHINIKPILGQTRLFIITAFLLMMSNLAFSQALNCSGLAQIPRTGTFTVNDLVITSSYTGDVNIYPYNNTISCTGHPIGIGSLWLGYRFPWTFTLTFNKPVNNIVLLLSATGIEANENFIFNSNGGAVSLYSDSPSKCGSVITGNQIISGFGLVFSPTSDGGGGLFRISAPNNFTSLTLNGAGGSLGALLQFCSSSLVAVPPVITSVTPATQKICMSTTPTPLTVAATGSGTLTYQWYKNAVNNNTSGTLITGATSASYTPPASAVAGTSYYYVKVTDANGTATSNTAEIVTVDRLAFVNLNSLYTGTHPDAPSTVIQWWSTPNRTPGTMVPDPTQVSQSGTYYAFFYDTVNKCYNTSNSTSSVVVNILPPCYCSKPGDFSVAGEPSKMGISVQKKESGWPENIPNGQIVLESKEKGFVITRVAHVSFVPETTDSVAEPFAGMLVYDIQDACVKLFNGVNWNCIKRSCNDIGN